ncbi:MAG TPA: phosphoribosylanthranilate isomerase [Gemmatimonadaceae bacterium]
MRVDVKFCGLTRAADALEAARLGAAYVGVVFAGGPRRVSPAVAAAILAEVPAGVARIGVIGRGLPEALAEQAAAAGLDGVQLHGDPDAAAVDAVRRCFGGSVWAVVRVEDRLPAGFDALAAAADAVVLDTRVAGRLGGSGIAFDWGSVARQLDRRRPRRLVVAGGLTPENVADAVERLAPDVVDVSSGVESAPGVKDHARMRAFVGALAAPGAV